MVTTLLLYTRAELFSETAMPVRFFSTSSLARPVRCLQLDGFPGIQDIQRVQQILDLLLEFDHLA